MRLSVCPSICTMPKPTHHWADVVFNWWQSGAATDSSQQQACCVRLWTLLGRTSVISAVGFSELYVSDISVKSQARLVTGCKSWVKSLGWTMVSSQVISLHWQGNGNLQTLIYVLVIRPRRCPTLSNPVRWQNWMAAYLGYMLCGWRRCFVADQLWFMTRIREEEDWQVASLELSITTQWVPIYDIFITCCKQQE